MKTAMAILILLAGAAHAQDADPAAGEAEFRKCRSCHMIQDDAGNDIMRGGRLGPNLWNIVGRPPAAQGGFPYGDGLLALREADPDFVWTEPDLAAYVTDPTAWIREKTGDDALRSKMTFKLNRNQADLAAFLGSHSPDAP